MNAWNDLQEILEPGEEVEAIVFGPWGWGCLLGTEEEENWELGFDEPDPPLVPFNKRGVVMTLEEAQQYMDGWSFYGGYGAPECYAVYIWTNQRIFWVTQYDGATGLNSAPRHPKNIMPNMPGGG